MNKLILVGLGVALGYYLAKSGCGCSDHASSGGAATADTHDAHGGLDGGGMNAVSAMVTSAPTLATSSTATGTSSGCSSCKSTLTAGIVRPGGTLLATAGF